MAVTWGTQTSGGTQLTAVNNTVEEFFDAITASDAILTEVELIVDNESGTVTDGLVVNVYHTQEGTPDWDDIPRFSFRYTPTGVAAEQISFMIPSTFKWRIGCLSTGATDTYAVDMNFIERTA